MITQIRLRDFRCFSTLEIAFDPGANFLIGANAQGKTSVLEAVCVLLRLHSPRTTQLSEAVRFGESRFALDGRCREAHLRMEYEPPKKSLTLDSKPQSRSEDYLQIARVAWFSNADLELVRGSGSTRRRYLDFAGSQCMPGYLKTLRSYERALRSRNALLKDGRPRREVEAFDGPLIAAGDDLSAARAELTLALDPLAQAACASIGGETLKISRIPGCTTALAEALAQSLSEETRLRQTVVGPHRDDLQIHLEGREAASFASEGQQRSIALALKLAQSRHIEQSTGTPPIFLMDDIFGELDATRRNHLLSSLPAGAQLIITTTSLAWRKPGDGAIFQLQNGEIKRQT